MPPEDDDLGPGPAAPGHISDSPVGRDAGLPARVPSPRFTVQVSLRETPAARDDIVQEAAREMADFEPVVQWDSAGRVVLTLQVAAADLWVAVLLAMAAVTQAGHQPEHVEALPATALERC